MNRQEGLSLNKSSALPLLVIVDDEPEILVAIKRCLMRLDIQIESFTSPRLAKEFLAQNEPDIILSDQRMPDISGIELLTFSQSLWPNTKRIMLSAYQDFGDISAGFNGKIIEHFIAKPWNNVELQTLIHDNISQTQATNSSIRLRNAIVGESKAMMSLMDNVGKAAGANVPVFIHGETGTGKELIARACHELGCRRNGAFIAVNCANFSEALIESQLFGHKKGAFTGAVNDQEGIFSKGEGGTIFLDEITTLPLSLQSKLLRVIQERTYSMLGSLEEIAFDAQVVSASSTSLAYAVTSGEFREDLFYRLNVIPLHIPPVRERDSDVLLLAEHFLLKFNSEQNKNITSFDESAKELLISHQWPGNVRQLENLIHSACIMNDGKSLSSKMLEDLITDAKVPMENIESTANTAHTVAGDAEVMPLHQVEKENIERAIAKCEGNVNKAAALLEVNPSTLYRKIKSWTD